MATGGACAGSANPIHRMLYIDQRMTPPLSTQTMPQTLNLTQRRCYVVFGKTLYGFRMPLGSMVPGSRRTHTREQGGGADTHEQ